MEKMPLMKKDANKRVHGKKKKHSKLAKAIVGKAKQKMMC